MTGYGEGYGDKDTVTVHQNGEPHLPSGDYQVYAKWPVPPANQGAGVAYQVLHDGGTQDVPVDQARDGGEWRLLGLYGLSQGQGHGARLNGVAVGPGVPVTVVDNTSPGVIADGSWTTSTVVTSGGGSYIGPNFRPPDIASAHI